MLSASRLRHESGAIGVRIALYTLPRIELPKKDKRISEYYRSKLEKLYSDFVKFGKLSKDFLDLYVKAVDYLDSGNISEFRKIFESLNKLSKSNDDLDFKYTPPCFNCALVTLSEGEYALKIAKIGLVSGNKEKYFRKIFFSYDFSGRLKIIGGIVNMEALKEIFENSFAAVA